MDNPLLKNAEALFFGMTEEEIKREQFKRMPIPRYITFWLSVRDWRKFARYVPSIIPIVYKEPFMSKLKCCRWIGIIKTIKLWYLEKCLTPTN